MNGSLAPPVRADGRPRINVELPRLGLTVYRNFEQPGIALGPAHGWFAQAIGGLRAGMNIAVLGDPELCSMLTTQIAVSIGAAGAQSLLFAMGTAPLAVVARARTLTADWPAEEARRAITSIELTPEAGDLRDLRAILDTAIDPRFGANRRVACVMVDRVTLGRRARVLARAAGDFAACAQVCAHAGAALIAIIGGADEAITPLLAQAGAVIELTGHGQRRCRMVVHGSSLAADTQIILERDGTTGELRPVVDEAPFIGRARTWIGGDDPFAELHAIVSPAATSRPRIVANGLSDRRVAQALSLIERLPFIDFIAVEHDVEVLLTGDTCYRTGFGLATVAAFASSIIRRAVPDDAILVGEIGLDRRVRPLSAAWVESITAAAAAGQIKSTTRLLVASRTAKQLDGLNCKPVAAPTLDAALLHIWPDLH